MAIVETVVIQYLTQPNGFPLSLASKYLHE